VDRQAYTVLNTFTALPFPANIGLVGKVAILMQGTTSELQADLQLAIDRGYINITVPNNDRLVIYYLRRKAGVLETKTVLSIAPAAGYWSLDLNQTIPPQLPRGDIKKSWHLMYSAAVSSVTLTNLRDPIVIEGHKKGAWF